MSCLEGDFVLNKINFVGGDKLLPVFKHGFLRSEENVFPVFLYTQNVYGKHNISLACTKRGNNICLSGLKHLPQNNGLPSTNSTSPYLSTKVIIQI